MPRYNYKCYDCNESFEVFHGILDDQEQCIYCSSSSLKRIPQELNIRRNEVSKDEKVGEATKRAIEENREILKRERKIRVEYKDAD